MKHRTKTALSLLLALCMVLGFFPGGIITARADGDVTYLDADGSTKSVNATSVTSSSTAVTWNAGWYVVDSNATISGRITVNGTVNLILADGANLTASQGITVTGANSLTIYAQSTDAATMGKLSATSGENGAGIGGGNKGAGGTITVNGGEVTAKGGENGAGIGGGSNGAGGTITVNGGAVTATGGKRGAGIGGGYIGAGGTITVNGGSVTATGGDGAAGIGGGRKQFGGTITVNGGEVTANSGKWSAGIGGGYEGASGAISITGGTVKANGNVGGTGDDGGAGIGGCDGGNNSGDGNSISITGGTVTATVKAGKGAAIGNGGNSGTDVSVTIGAGATVEAGASADGTGAASTTAADVANNTSYKYVKFNVTPVAVTGVTLDQTTLSLTPGGDTATLTATVAPSNASNKTVTWTTSAASVATVSNGVVTPVGSGTATITATSNNGKTATCTVTVHAHNFGSTYQVTQTNAPNDTITATCSVDGCDLTDGKASLTIRAPESEAGGAAVLDGDADAFGVSASSVKYYQKSGSDWTEISGTPSGSGFFKGSLTIASSYTIEAAYGVNAITVASGIENGAITAPPVATVGAVVPLTITPALGYELDALSPTKTNGGAEIAVSKDEDGSKSFIMPEESVTVSATFVGRSVSVSLNVTGNEGTTCTAKLLNDDFTEATGSLTKKAGERFILIINRDDDYDFNVTFNPGGDAGMEEFTKEEYENYIDYAMQNDISVPASAVLAWVTMPGVTGDSLTVTVSFSKLKTFTILYQPEGSPARAWCKFAMTESGTENIYAFEMNSDVAMGDGTKVYSLKVTAAFDPKKAAFVTTDNTTITETEATDIMNRLEVVDMTNVAARQTAPTQDSDWTGITDSGKFCVIGGNAKTVIAAFVSDAGAMAVYKSDSVTYDAGEGSGVTYRLAVVIEEGGAVTAGSVTAPAAPTKDGYDFAGWRGFEGAAPNRTEKIYNAGDSVSIYENTTLNAVWKRKTLSITLNLNGGTGGSSVTSVTYGSTLSISENPTKNGYAFNGWTVSEAVTENGVSFAKGSPFDFNTPITDNLKLTARWKHVHSYACFRVTRFSSLEKYHKYDSAVHVAICGCGDVQLNAHEFDSNGKCACGYEKPGPKPATLNTSYGQWSGGNYTEKMRGMPEEAKQDQEVSIYAPNIFGSLQFSKWQYNLGTSKWNDLAAAPYVSFLIPANMQVRALYVNPITEPQVELSAREYDDQTVVDGQTYTMGNILFQMNYKLPDGYNFVDAGIRLGDNAGISYYELKDKRIGLTLDGRGTAFGIGALSSVAGFFTCDWTMMKAGGQTVGLSASPPESSTYYAERENSVLKEYSAETVATYMYERKPINVEKYDPIYWEAKANTKGMSGSVATLPPLRFAQKNNQNHYIYGIGWLRYKDSSGNVKTIYTDALAATVNNIPTNTVTKSGS